MCPRRLQSFGHCRFVYDQRLRSVCPLYLASLEGYYVWTCTSLATFDIPDAVNQFSEFLASLSHRITNSGTLSNYRSCVNTAICLVFSCESLSEAPRIAKQMRDFRKEKPSQPRWSHSATYWDPGLIIDYWARQPDNDLLSTAQLGRKSFTLVAIACWPRCSCAARVVRSSVQIFDGGVSFQYKGTKELKVPILSPAIGIASDQVKKICPALALKAYLHRTRHFDHNDRVWCISRHRDGVFTNVSGKGDTLRRWMRDAMTAVGIPKHWTGGSIRMAASSRAIDMGVEPAFVLQIGRWKSYAMWNQFYNRSCCRAAFCSGSTAIISDYVGLCRLNHVCSS